MFGKSPSKERPAAGTETGLKATGVYIDLVAGLKQQVADLRRNNLILLSFLGLCLIGLVLAMPLRKRIPYFFEVDSSSGRVGLTNRVAEELKVSDKNVAYFMRLWVARLATINAATLKDGLPSAYRWTRASAQTELDEWTEKTDRTAERIAKTPGLTRELLGQPTVSFNEDRNIGFIDFSWIEKINGIETERKRKLLTLEFGLVPPKNADEDPDNPLGIAITHFTVNDQVTK
jgi:type IV secretion system protein TrbF